MCCVQKVTSCLACFSRRTTAPQKPLISQLMHLFLMTTLLLSAITRSLPLSLARSISGSTSTSFYRAISSTSTALFSGSPGSKRSRHVGTPKATDSGKYSVTYSLPSSPTAHSSLPYPPPYTPSTPPFYVLGIETSCDDTAAAIVSSTGYIVSESIKSQHDIHASYGGIVPGLARAAHESAIDFVVADALDKANLAVTDLQGIAATVGPGLEICLRVGATAATELATKHNLPFAGVHHLEAHVLTSRLASLPATPDFPFLSLLTSGGHLQLLVCHDIGEYTVLGGTLDDSLGEAYDKVARMLDLDVGAGGGPAVEKLAREGDHTRVKLPIPMQQRKDCDFSFAGLKNAFRLAVSSAKTARNLAQDEALPRQDAADLAASFQHSAIKVRHAVCSPTLFTNIVHQHCSPTLFTNAVHTTPLCSRSLFTHVRGPIVATRMRGSSALFASESFPWSESFP